MEKKYEIRGRNTKLLNKNGKTNLKNRSSVFAPLIRTSRALIEQGCRLITRPNLNLHEVGAFVVAVVCVFALDLRIVDIFPGFFPA